MERRGKEETKLVTVVSAEIAPAPKSPAPTPNRIVPTFEAWWVLTAQSLKLKPALKVAIQRHFESRGFMANNEFDKGLKDFGIKA